MNPVHYYVQLSISLTQMEAFWHAILYKAGLVSSCRSVPICFSNNWEEFCTYLIHLRYPDWFLTYYP